VRPLLVLVLSAFATGGAARADDSTRLLAHLEAAYGRYLAANPSLATSLGDSSGDERWEDLTEAGSAAAAAAARGELDRLNAGFEGAALAPRAAVQRRVYAAQLERELERHRWRDHLYPLNQIVGPHIDVPSVLEAQRVADASGAEAWLRRLEAAAPYIDGLVQRLERQSAAGVWLPRSVSPILLGQARGLLEGMNAAAGGPVVAGLGRKLAALDLPVAQRERWLAESRRLLRDRVAPAYARLVVELEDHAARSTVDGGVWQLPEGGAFYAFLLRQFTTTDLTAEEVHALGLAEVARVHGEMRALMQRLGGTGDLRAFMQAMKQDPRFFLADDAAGREAYLARSRAIVAAMQARIGEVWPGPVPLPLEIRATEPYRAAGAPSGFYEAGTPDGQRPGVVYLNVERLDTRPLYDLEALLYHESIPGHHLQISSILVDPGIPRLRRVNRWWQDTAFVEGWALYAERLAREMGFYQDPWSDFGRLAGELWRATRLVVDSGLHARRWSREQAIRYLDDNTPSPRAANESAVDRYLAVPGQATAFTVGMLHILKERERARAALGDAFDLRAFHAAVLENGYVPLWAVTDSVDRYVAARRGTTRLTTTATAALIPIATSPVSQPGSSRPQRASAAGSSRAQ
jgi:uncharacterized protein (DUF885 family)